MRYLIILIMLFCFISCRKNEAVPENKTVDYAMLVAQSACMNVPVNWLGDLLVKAEEDRTTGAHQFQYRGKVAIMNFKNKTLFVVDFNQGSGGIMYYLYTCSGDFAVMTPDDAVQLTSMIPKAKVIYNNMPDLP